MLLSITNAVKLGSLHSKNPVPDDWLDQGSLLARPASRTGGALPTLSRAAIVLDGEQRAALAVVRSLGRQGWQVHVGSAIAKSLAGGSRFARTETLLPDPLKGAEFFSSAVARLAALHAAKVVLPVAEASTLALLEHPALPEHVAVPTSSLRHFRRACDKAEVLSIAGGLGIDVPSQWIIGSKAGAPPALEAEAFPLVIKPSRSVVGEEGDRRKTGVAYADSPDRLAEVLARFDAGAYPLMIQSRIEGPGLGVFLLRWRGKVLATFAHRRIREKPPSGGVSVYSESVAAPPALLAQSEALLEVLEWSGVAMVEFKQDRRSGRNYLMEVNPRFWGSLQLAIDSGVDFPRYLVETALGEQATPAGAWKIGIRSRWRWGDIDHLLTRLRHSKGDLNLPADAPGLFRLALSVLTPWRPGERSDVFRISDPVPSFRETFAWIRAL